MAVATANTMYGNVYHLADITKEYWNWAGVDHTLTNMKSIGQENGSTADANLTAEPAVNCAFLSPTNR
jgi:hypothetical protein